MLEIHRLLHVFTSCLLFLFHHSAKVPSIIGVRRDKSIIDQCVCWRRLTCADEEKTHPWDSRRWNRSKSQKAKPVRSLVSKTQLKIEQNLSLLREKPIGICHNCDSFQAKMVHQTVATENLCGNHLLAGEFRGLHTWSNVEALGGANRHETKTTNKTSKTSSRKPDMSINVEISLRVEKKRKSFYW